MATIPSNSNQVAQQQQQPVLQPSVQQQQSAAAQQPIMSQQPQQQMQLPTWLSKGSRAIAAVESRAQPRAEVRSQR